MSVSLAQGKYCDANQLDPEDPRCAHVILTGRMQKVNSDGSGTKLKAVSEFP